MRPYSKHNFQSNSPYLELTSPNPRGPSNHNTTRKTGSTHSHLKKHIKIITNRTPSTRAHKH